jgi:uncharacterized integral membrane protein
LAFAGAVGVFAWQNQQEVTVTFFQWATTAQLALVIGVGYLLGMLSGWSVVGMLRRTVNRTAELFNQQREHAHAVR